MIAHLILHSGRDGQGVVPTQEELAQGSMRKSSKPTQTYASYASAAPVAASVPAAAAPLPAAPPAPSSNYAPVVVTTTTTTTTPAPAVEPIKGNYL